MALTFAITTGSSTNSAGLVVMIDPTAERMRKIGALTLHSIGEISVTSRMLDNDADYVEPHAMLAELVEDNKNLAQRLREEQHLRKHAISWPMLTRL